MSDLIGQKSEQGVSSSITGLRDKPTSYGASIVSREAAVRFYSSGSSTYNSRSNRQLTIKLSSTNYIDPSTACLCFRLKTGSATGQVPESDFPLCFQSVTLRVGGRVVEDIQNANDVLRPLFYMGNSADVVKSTPGHYKFNRVNSAIINVTSTGTVTGSSTVVTDPSTPSFNTGTELGVPGALSNTLPNTSTYLLTSSGNLTIPEGCAWSRGTLSKEFDNRLVSGTGGLPGRTYCMPLRHIFGLFRSESFVPLRNMQSIQLDFVLSEYNKCFINTVSYTGGADLVTDSASFTNVDLQDYELISPYVSVDVVSPSEGTVALIDGMAASAEGIAMLYDSYSTQKQTVQYATSINLQTSKSYSHVRDSFLFLTPSQINNGSTCLDLANQYMYGSRVSGHQTSIGSSLFPSQICDNSAESLFQLKKALGNHDTHTTSILDHNMYLGLNPVTDNVDRAFFPSLIVAQNQNSSNAYKLASVFQGALLPYTPHSLFCIAASFEKSINKGGKSLSGVNTRLTSSQINFNINLRDIKAAAATDPDSAIARYSVDCIAGTGPITTIACIHYEALLVVQNNSIVVAD